MRTFYIVYQPSGPIYGIGTSKEEAIKDASNWCDTREGLKTVECSKELYDLVKEEGGQVRYRIINNYAVVA